jgi:murein DD-endopeptidase MepM/ murein hydrolase activator NlpD
MGTLLLAACLSEEKAFGRSAGYNSSYPEPIDVVIPANAPSITQQFRGRDFSGSKKKWDEHYGTDFHAPVGTPVLAVADGVVINSFWEPAYGNRVEIRHAKDANGYAAKTRYVHLKTRLVEKGDVLKRGDQLGELGTTGFLSSGFPHLHMEVVYGPRDSLVVYGKDANLFWLDGVGKITCYTPELRDVKTEYFRMTYPVPCR